MPQLLRPSPLALHREGEPSCLLAAQVAGARAPLAGQAEAEAWRAQLPPLELKGRRLSLARRERALPAGSWARDAVSSRGRPHDPHVLGTRSHSSEGREGFAAAVRSVVASCGFSSEAGLKPGSIHRFSICPNPQTRRTREEPWWESGVSLPGW